MRARFYPNSQRRLMRTLVASLAVATLCTGRRVKFGHRLVTAAAIAVVFLLPAAARAQPHLADQADVTYPPGWNLVGGPAGSQLAGTSGSLYTWQWHDSTYQVVDPAKGLTGGYGYWAYFPSGGSAALGAGGPCTIAVPIGAGGWVLVGNPWPNGTTSVRGVDRVYIYDPASGYTPSTTLHPGQAAWAYAAVATTVALVVEGCPTASNVPPSPPVNP